MQGGSSSCDGPGSTTGSNAGSAPSMEPGVVPRAFLGVAQKLKQKSYHLDLKSHQS